MRGVVLPLMPITSWSLTVTAHSRGGAGAGGHEVYEVGGGAAWAGGFSVAAMPLSVALEVRAAFHAARGRSGAVLWRVPGALPPQLNTTIPAGFGEWAIYTDGQDFDDSTTYDDAVTLQPETISGDGPIGAAAAAGADTIEVPASPLFDVGAWLTVGSGAHGGQLVRITALTGTTATIRPRLRSAAASGTRLLVGRPYALFRLSKTPVIPIRTNRSAPFEVELEEFWNPYA